ncbi:MAG TPA: class I SAM-dependent methyltransferase [Thermoanaerobaculia bacterium]
MPTPSPSTVSFDGQAPDFDLRAGLPAGVAQRVAAALAELAPAGDGVILDLGAGTGQIGEHLAGGRSRYLGIDVSGPMLAVFRRKLGARAHGALVRADGGVPWPIASGRVKLVFSSRAAHLLPPAVLVEETLRVASPAGALAVFGGVRSEPDSLRAVLRREMRRLLAEHGVEARRAGDAQGRLAGALAERGGEVLPVRTAASWTVVHRAGDALAAWRAKSGLGGRAVTPEVQDSVLHELESWIRERYGSLDVARDATERYELTAVRLPEFSKRTIGEEKE